MPTLDKGTSWNTTVEQSTASATYEFETGGKYMDRNLRVTVNNVMGEIVHTTKLDSTSNATSTARTYSHLNIPSGGVWLAVGMLDFASGNGTRGVGLTTSGSTTTGEFSNRSGTNNSVSMLVQVTGIFNLESGGTINLNGYSSSSVKVEHAHMYAVKIAPYQETITEYI